MSNNAIPFPGASNVPILGQPMKLNTWFPTVCITCNCAAQSPLLLIGFGGLTTCPACLRGFRILAASEDVRTGQPPHFHFDIVMPPRRDPADVASALDGARDTLALTALPPEGSKPS